MPERPETWWLPLTRSVESESYQQLLGIGKGDVGDGPRQEALEERSWFHGSHGTHPV